MRYLFSAIFLLTLAFASPVHAQDAPRLQADSLGISYLFGSPITFQARLLNVPGPISEAYILFRADGEPSTRVFPVTVAADGVTTFIYSFEQGPIRPFATLRYQYRVKLQDGQELFTDEFSFLYYDNRFPWQEREADGVRIHWYAGDERFGQDALDVAREGLQRSKQLLLVEPAARIDIYIYASVTDLQKALETGGVSWAGGHASPDLRVGMVSIAPGAEQGLEMDREIPHELAHIVTYDLTRERYQSLPVWLREGIASQTEITTNPDYPRAITLASESQSLLSFGDLCASFPPDSGRAFLAYAQSDVFTRFVIEKYGQSGLLALIQAYGDGLDCEQGAVRALGQPLTQLEAEWKSSSLGMNRGFAVLGNFLPYLILLIFVMAVPLTNALLFKGVANGKQ